MSNGQAATYRHFVPGAGKSWALAIDVEEWVAQAPIDVDAPENPIPEQTSSIDASVALVAAVELIAAPPAAEGADQLQASGFHVEELGSVPSLPIGLADVVGQGSSLDVSVEPVMTAEVRAVTILAEGVEQPQGSGLHVDETAVPSLPTAAAVGHSSLLDVFVEPAAVAEMIAVPAIAGGAEQLQTWGFHFEDTAPAASHAQPSGQGEDNGHFICSVCHDTFRRPVVTICLHVFCDQCLSSNLQYSTACPLCRAEICYEPLRDVLFEDDLEAAIQRGAVMASSSEGRRRPYTWPSALLLQ
ncbi:hypothetical protein C8R47DRAFT_1222262 [Mycena vitilis]|nr:hypothetical protein C8R47DRAFT_1222262 [Mycena vitilis]